MTRAASDPPPAAPRPAAEAPPPPGNSWLYRICRSICRTLVTVYFGLKVYGLEHVPPSGGFLIISNHQSVLDPVLVGVRVPRFISYMARKTLFKNRFFGWFIHNLNAFPVDQSRGDTGAVKEAIARLKAGHVLVMFPEGHRTPDGELLPILPGVALIIRRAEVPVIPVVVDGAYKSWPKGGHNKLPRRVPIHVQFGPAMNFEGLKGDQITAQIDRTFRELLAELRTKP